MTKAPTQIADLFRIHSRYLRSAHLERDFRDPAALRGYVLTSQIQSGLERLALGLAPESGQRAWRITGDYGSGKSSFALLLAHAFSKQRTALPKNLQASVAFKGTGIPQPQLLPVLLTGSRQPLSPSLLRALLHTLENLDDSPELLPVVDAIRMHLEPASDVSDLDSTAVELLEQAADGIKRAGLASGLLIIVDELGKFLEYAAQQPDRQDIYVLQRLAEAAARSGKRPLFLVALLHQGFNAYAHQLSPSSQREWEKVAGRFEELLFDHSLDQITGLIASALNVRRDMLPPDRVSEASSTMRAACDLGWYGAVPPESVLVDLAPSLYPLHATVVPALAKVFARFGQNERSLFGFLLSHESCALQEFASRPIAEGQSYRLCDLYDYTRATFGHAISVQSYRSHWPQIDSIIASVHTENLVELQVLKTVGLLNLLDIPGINPTREAIVLAVASAAPESQRAVEEALQRLHQTMHLLHYRGPAGGYCLWPYTSVNLDLAYQEAVQALGSIKSVSGSIQNYLQTRPLVARRHYIETGNLRYFDVVYTPLDQLQQAVQGSTNQGAGRLLIPLCETPSERSEALKFAQLSKLADKADMVLGIPQPLSDLAGLLQEAQRWQWIRDNIPALAHDAYAAEEVDRLVTATRQALEKRLAHYLGVHQGASHMELTWYHRGQNLQISDRRALLSFLSDVCDQLYPAAPWIHNELVNRQMLSSAAAAARMRLIELILTASDQPYLGLNPQQTPPEMSMYLSVLQRARLHQQLGGRWIFVEPAPNEDVSHVLPAVRQIQHVLTTQPDLRVPVSNIFEELRKPPYGLRDGVIPLLLAVFAMIHQHDVAFYENGTFLTSLGEHDFRRLIRWPETFELQYCEVTDIRAQIFLKMREILGASVGQPTSMTLLDVVRPLIVFASRLPDYTRKSRSLSTAMQSVRDLLLTAREPARLLFYDLPGACGFTAFAPDTTTTLEDVDLFIERLRTILDELHSHYPRLLDHIARRVQHAFDMNGEISAIRSALARRAEQVVTSVADQRLRAFCFRLVDTSIPDERWLESLGSFACAKVPEKWSDQDLIQFDAELAALSERFVHVESMVIRPDGQMSQGAAIRLAVTQSDGIEVERILYAMPDEENEISAVEQVLGEMLRRRGRLGLIAASRAIRQILSGERAVEK